jgi:hypothetical protein
MTLIYRFFFGTPDEEVQPSFQAEIIYLRASLKRMKKENDILKEKSETYARLFLHQVRN